MRKSYTITPNYSGLQDGGVRYIGYVITQEL
jgi:hypothetical protein